MVRAIAIEEVRQMLRGAHEAGDLEQALQGGDG